ncbi:MAG: ribonuclease E/G [Holosporaceae bacterium]|jgi:ribonuclease E|nr:ribonuclease E/G [Holosporaceae bacterium]
MPKNMLIDSAHLEEIRVAVVEGEKLDKFDFEISSKTHIKGNIYLAKIVRVEPALQAAFVDYGNDRHGFLSFSEIHHDYFQIPVGDRKDLDSHIQNAISALLAETGESVEELDPQEVAKLRYQFYRRYKIQEVIKKRQIVLVQVTKEERGNKGAALTTYITLAGRYCVLMPNTPRGSGVSRKITNSSDRTKLKKIVTGLHIENGSTVIRTAGVSHSKLEITKDFYYLKKTWDEIRETTVKSTAPCPIHEEASIIKRAIRDLYSRDVESIFVEGEEGYKIAKSFVKKLMPSHVRKVKLYEDKKLPLFNKFKINDQINQIYSTRVNLPSGGYLIINTTEALISIDVNSGKSIRERNIAETALKTNLEAAVEIARQCRLRDLAGLIVVDFIDMMEKRNNSQVEKCLRDALREDKAKIQMGTISNFGLLEFSRQRLRSSIADANTAICPNCNGSGFVWSNESIALQVLRKIDETLAAIKLSDINVTLSADVVLYLMNNKRSFISNLEERAHSKITFKIDNTIFASDFKIEQIMRQITKEESESSDIEERASVDKEKNKDSREMSSDVSLSAKSGKAMRSSRNNRRRHFRKKSSKEDAVSHDSDDNKADIKVILPSEEEVLLSQESAVTHINKLAESYKEQEIMFNLQSTDGSIAKGKKKKDNKSGLWRKLLNKLE